MIPTIETLNGRAALVTGGSRGIGRAICVALAAAGVRVAVGYRREQAAAQEVVAAIGAGGGEAVACKADVSDPEEAAGLVVAARDALGPIDILVNNAGINPSKPFDQLSNADWETTSRTNLSSVFYVSQAAIGSMRERRWGRIITISSTAAQTGGVVGPHYAASKAGILGLMHSYASLLAKEGVTANAIAPALIETDMLKGNDKIKPSFIPIGRFGQPEEVASVVVVVAANGYITGQTINVNGGRHMS